MASDIVTSSEDPRIEVLPESRVIEFNHLERPTLRQQFVAKEHTHVVSRNSTGPAQEWPNGPNIDWVPSFVNYMERSLRRQKNQVLCKFLPQGFPSVVSYPMVWSGNNLSQSQYVQTLSPKDVKEIEDGLNHFKGMTTCITFYDGIEIQLT